MFKTICNRLMILFFCTMLHACSDTSDGQFTIVTTTSILADIVKNIVKGDVRVESLMGPGIDPHTYQGTHNDTQKLRNANVIIYNGLYLEGRMNELLGKLQKERAVYAAGDALHKDELIFDENVYPMGVDPHVWFDVQLCKKVTYFLSQKLQALRPESAPYYQNNTVAYLEQLDQLHEEVSKQIQSIPEPQRVLVTAHDAFSYFGRAYNIQVVGLQGVSTASECGLKDIQDVVQLIVQKNIKAVFFETSVSDKSMRAVLEGCAHYGHQVAIGGALYSDALGAADKSEGTYCGMVKANTDIIVNALK